jgi:stage IV sporulation protein FB
VSQGSPGGNQGVLHFVLFGIPVRIQPLFWLVALLLGSQSQDLQEILIWIVALFLGILWHELGHAAVVRSFGFYPWILLYGMGGLTSYNTAHGLRTARLTPLRQILISLAGPMAGFLLAAIVVGAIIVAGHGRGLEMDLGGSMVIDLYYVDPNHLRLMFFINKLFFICIVWGLVNLLPIYPLDGGQIARQIFLAANPNRGYYWSLVVSLISATSMAIIGGLIWQSMWIAILFGYMAYMNYMVLQSNS